MVVQLQEFVFVIIGSVILSLAILVGFWPWARQPRKIVTIALTTAIGILIWNVALNLTNASGLNVDVLVLGLSVQDVGSGVLAFLTTFLVLRLLTDRTQASRRTLLASAIVGVATIAIDRFG